jgi:hypothetical protein
LCQRWKKLRYNMVVTWAEITMAKCFPFIRLWLWGKSRSFFCERVYKVYN